VQSACARVSAISPPRCVQNRIIYPEFLKRYYLLDPAGKVPRKASDPKAATQMLMKALDKIPAAKCVARVCGTRWCALTCVRV
jgi:hypothetical protein